MSKFKKFYNNNRIYCTLMIISVFCLLLIAGAFVYYFIEQTKNDVYGNRLNGISSVEIKDSHKKDIISKVKENDKVDSLTIDVKGKIIYFIINLKDGSVEDAEGIAIKSLEYLTNDEKEFYDINYTFTNKADNDNAKLFPIMGYKKSDATIISWTKTSEK
jgi:hypothetical protein